MNRKQFTTSDVTIAVLNYNGMSKIPDLFDSLKTLKQPAAEILFVDDGSTDSSTTWVGVTYPEVRIITLPENTGILNHVRNKALGAAKTDLVLIVDNDVMLLPDTIEEALTGLNELPDAVVCLTRAVYEGQTDKIYQDGQILHYVGASPNLNRDKLICEVDREPRLSIGWGVQLINRVKTEQVGWFNENYFLGWGDDGEFNHKLNMAGLKCYHIPASVVVHKRHQSSKRYFSAVTNRWRFLLEMYAFKTLILTAPALLLYEVFLILFLIMKGSIKEYFKGMSHCFKNISSILHERKKIQQRRVVPDRDIIGCGEIFVYTDEFTSPVIVVGYKIMNMLFSVYWKVISKIL